MKTKLKAIAKCAFQFTQCYSSEGCLFTLENTCDVEF